MTSKSKIKITPPIKSLPDRIAKAKKRPSYSRNPQVTLSKPFTSQGA